MTKPVDFTLLGDTAPVYVPTRADQIAWLRSELARMDAADASTARLPPPMPGCEAAAYGPRSLDRVNRPRYAAALARLEAEAKEEPS